MARFDLYEGRKAWWWVFFLSYAAAKDKIENQAILMEMLVDAVEYKDFYDKSRAKELIEKYELKGFPK